MGAFSVPSDYLSDPSTRKRLIQSVMGSDPSAAMNPAQPDRIADDLTRHPQGMEGTQDLESQATPQRLLQRMQSQTPQAPSHLDQLQSQYDQMQAPQQKPLSPWKTALTGVLTGGIGIPLMLKNRQMNQQFEEDRFDRNRASLLTQIEAEKRMQEQEQMQGQRETAADERQATLQRDIAARTAPHTVDTAQGPMQWDMNTRQWSPIMVGGQPVGPKASAKPDTAEQQFLDSPEEQGKTLTQKMQDWARITQKPEQPQRPPQQLAIGPDGTVIDLKPGVKVPQGTQSTTGFEKGATAGQAGKDAMQYANDYMNSGRFTGPGDEALMEKFFELAKPSSGFRMTQAQIEMLQRARDLMGGLSAKAKHYFTPEAPYFSDEQRRQIVETMTRLEGAKGQQGAQSQGGLTPPGPAQPNMKWQHRTTNGKTEWRQVPQ